MAKKIAGKPPARKASAPRKIDRRGTPKGKGVSIGGPGAKTAGPKPKGRIGNPPFKATPEQRKIAETHAAVGSPHWAIAEELGISETTLALHFRKELDFGLIRMNARIGSAIGKKAIDGDGDMQKYWMSRRGGDAWANKAQLELGGPGGGPIKHQISPDIDLSKLSVEELKELKRLRGKAVADESPGT